MRFRYLIFVVFGIFLLVGLKGCQNSPGSIFSPVSDVHVLSGTPSPLKVIITEGEGKLLGTAEDLKISFNIMNGVSFFLDTYTINYVTTNGQPLQGGTLDFTGALAQHINAPDPGLAKEGIEAGSVSFQAVPPSVWLYLCNQSFTVSDDVSPVIGKVTLTGHDTNNNRIVLPTHVTIVVTNEEKTK